TQTIRAGTSAAAPSHVHKVPRDKARHAHPDDFPPESNRASDDGRPDPATTLSQCAPVPRRERLHAAHVANESEPAVHPAPRRQLQSFPDDQTNELVAPEGGFLVRGGAIVVSPIWVHGPASPPQRIPEYACLAALTG